MRSKFKRTGLLPVMEIRLDQNNYRLGPLDSQTDCVEIMFKEFGSKMTKLAGHIAKYGMSPRPIVVTKDDKRRWVVRDGNRRIVALKCLNNPAEAPGNYKHSFNKLKKNAVPGTVQDKIDCLTADEATIIEYRKLEHMGAQDGIGQVNWDARAKENLQADVDGKLLYPLAGAICEYLIKKGVPEAGRVSISNMERLFQDAETARRIGILWDGQNFFFTAKENEVRSLLNEIIIDFTKRGKNRKKVEAIYYPADRKRYIDELFGPRGIKEPTPLPKPAPPSGKQPPKGKPSPAKTPTKTTPPWDRKGVIKRGMGLPVPDSEVKLNTVLVELSSGVDVRKATIAAGALVRLVLERSVDYYMKKNRVPRNKPKLHQRITKTANHMEKDGIIKQPQREQLEKMSRSEELISAHTLHAWVHNPDYSPVPREVCTFWDNIYFFLLECWK